MNFWTGLLWIYGMHLVLVAFYLVFKKKLSDAKSNRLLFLSILLVPLAVWIPIPSIEVVQNELFVVQLPEITNQFNGAAGTNFPLEALYFIPLIAFGAGLLVALVRIIVQLKRSSIKKEQGLWVIESDRIEGAKSFFKIVMLPTDMDTTNRALVFAHEQFHAEQWHSIDRLLMRCARVFFWANPLLYFLEREMMLNHEYLARSGGIKYAR